MATNTNYSSQNNMNGPLTALIIMAGIIILAWITYRYGIPIFFKERQQTMQQQPSGSTINVKVNPTP